MNSSVGVRLSGARGVARVPIEGIEIFVRRSFLSEKDCAYLIDLIDSDAQRSRLLGPDNPDMNFRTSYTHDFCEKNHVVKKVNARISAVTGLPPSHGEPLQGQRYYAGQEFKPHYDALWGEHLENPLLGAGGQRTWTIMIYLNTPAEGGKTFFPTAGVRIKPRTGSFLAWNGLDDAGNVNALSYHQGEPVHQGEKYILTKWFRQNEYALPK